MGVVVAVVDPVMITGLQFEAVVGKLVERLNYEAFNLRHSPAGWTPAVEDVRAWCAEILAAGDIWTQHELLRVAVEQAPDSSATAFMFPVDREPVLPLAESTMVAFKALTPVEELRSTIPRQVAPQGPVQAAEVPRPGEGSRTLYVRLKGTADA